MRRWLTRVTVWSALFVLVTVGLLWRPVDTAGLQARPLPALSYGEAMARAEALLARDTAAINPVCRTRLLTHGDRAAAAIVLIHGFTNCPKQFEVLGQEFFERGYNVLIPRQPHHGLANRLTEELATLTAEEMAATADQAVDIAHGLGERVIVMGLSTGGVMTSWVAQERADVDLAVVLVPLFGRDAPTVLARPTTQLALLIPNQFIWWSDEAARTAATDTFHAYPRYSTRAGGEAMRLGEAVLQQAERARPRARAVTVVTIENDERVGNQLTNLLVERWRARQTPVRIHQFPAHQRVPHDLIDPAQGEQRIDIVYPTLIELVETHP